MDQKIERLTNDLSSNKLRHFEGNKYHAIYKTLFDLSDYDKEYSVLLDFFYEKNRKEIDRSFEIINIGSLIILMKQEGCSNKQSFSFFSEWSGKSVRHIADCLYDYRREYGGRLDNDLKFDCNYFLFQFSLIEQAKKVDKLLTIDGPLDWVCNPVPVHYANHYFRKIVASALYSNIEIRSH